MVDNFNKPHDDVQVCWTNAGAGGDEYDKFQTAVTAGTGAPDVVMIEADRIASFQVQNALVDLRDSATKDVKDNYSEGAWKDISVGNGVYGASDRRRADGDDLPQGHLRQVRASRRRPPGPSTRLRRRR